MLAVRCQAGLGAALASAGPIGKPAAPMVELRKVCLAAAVVAAAAVLAGVGCAAKAVGPGVTTTRGGDEHQHEEEQASQIERAVGLAGSAELQTYVSAIGQRLAGQAGRDTSTYTFRIVDIDAANAFALPGGHVYISRGLLTLANSEAELANVMAHEIAHVAARHSLKQARRAVLLSPFKLAGDVAGGIAGAAASILSPTLGSALADAGEDAGRLVSAKYSRDQERAADRLGQRMAARAGWDAGAMSTFLARLRREDAFERGGPRGASFFDSHPDTAERVATTASFASGLATAGAARETGDEKLFFHIDGLRLDDDPDLGVFAGATFFHPRQRLTMTFPHGWVRRNARTYVAAIEPAGMAYVMLTFVGRGDDAMVAASLARRQFPFSLNDVTRTTINGLRAARLSAAVVSTQGPVSVEIAWIVLDDRIYQISAASPAAKSVGYRDELLDAINSFRYFDPADAPPIRVRRLRIVRAHEGESLEHLIDRTKAVWSPGWAAVINGLEEGDRLEAGRAIKIAVEETYMLNGNLAR